MFSFAAGGKGWFVSSKGPPGIECISANARIETTRNTITIPVIRPSRYKSMLTRSPPTLSMGLRGKLAVADVLGDVERSGHGVQVNVPRPVDRGVTVLVRLQLGALQVRPEDVGDGAVIDEDPAHVGDQQPLGVLEHLDARRGIAGERRRRLHHLVVLRVL